MSTALIISSPSTASPRHRPQPRRPWALMLVVLAAHGLALWALQLGLVVTSLPANQPAVHVQLLSPMPASASPMLRAAASSMEVPAPPARSLAPRLLPRLHPSRLHAPMPQPAPKATATATIAPLPPEEIPSRTQAKPVTPVEPGEVLAQPAAAAVAASAALQTIRKAGTVAATVATSPDSAVTQPAFGAAYLHNPKPAYPPLARRLGEEGTVILRVKISAQGQVDHLHLQQSSGYGPLDTAAMDAVQQWTFIPARSAGKPQAGWVEVPVRFSLTR